MMFYIKFFTRTSILDYVVEYEYQNLLNVARALSPTLINNNNPFELVNRNMSIIQF